MDYISNQTRIYVIKLEMNCQFLFIGNRQFYFIIYICKEGDPEDWIILPFVHVDLRKSEYTNIRLQIEKDYYYICELLKKHIETSTDGFIHTSSGELIQIRSKDSKPYTPIYSKLYKRNVSNKNHAFYFKKDFMRYINSDRY